MDSSLFNFILFCYIGGENVIYLHSCRTLLLMTTQSPFNKNSHINHTFIEHFRLLQGDPKRTSSLLTVSTIIDHEVKTTSLSHPSNSV